MVPKVLLITASFPYTGANESTFLKDEVAWLSGQARLTVMPLSNAGEKEVLPSGIKVDDTLAQGLSKPGFRYALIPFLVVFFALLASELLNRPRVFLKWKHFKRLVCSIQRCYEIRSFLKTSRDFLNADIVYTYWISEATLASATCRSGTQKLVTRGHGKDIYEFRNNGYLPLRSYIFRHASKVLPVSKAGAAYLRETYPRFRKVVDHCYLGTRKPQAGMLNPSEESNGIVRVVSCSSIIPLKRVEVIAEAIGVLAGTETARKFEWVHFGDGPGLKVIRKLSRDFPSNLSCQLPGAVPNEAIIDCYTSTHVDAFVNASETEGIPVSIMEALSYGIPIIAGDVGGVGEIVNDRVGTLLPGKPSVQQLAEALVEMTRNRQWHSKRTEAFRQWRLSFNFEENIHLFWAKVRE